MKTRMPVLQRDWLPSSGFGNEPTHSAVDMLADAVVQLDGETQKSEAELRARLAAQDEQLMQLRATVAALRDLLIERQLVDRDQLQWRTDSELAALRPPPEPPPPSGPATGGPYRSGPAASAGPEPMETCLRCGNKVPISDTHITGAGLLCDRCWNQQSIE